MEVQDNPTGVPAPRNLHSKMRPCAPTPVASLRSAPLSPTSAIKMSDCFRYSQADHYLFRDIGWQHPKTICEFRDLVHKNDIVH